MLIEITKKYLVERIRKADRGEAFKMQLARGFSSMMACLFAVCPLLENQRTAAQVAMPALPSLPWHSG